MVSLSRKFALSATAFEVTHNLALLLRIKKFEQHLILCRFLNVFLMWFCDLKTDRGMRHCQWLTNEHKTANPTLSGLIIDSVLVNSLGPLCAIAS